jgi:hypothetical protein
MKLLKLLTAIALITNVSLANINNDTLDKGYSGVGISYLSLSGDVEGDGLSLHTTYNPGEQNLVLQAQFQYLTADKILGADLSALNIEAYNIALGLGYIIELAEKVHLVPNLGYQYTEYGILGYEAATMDSLVYGAMVRYLLLDNTVLSAGVNFTSGELDSAITEFDGLETDAEAYTISVTHHFNDEFSAGIAYGTNNASADVLGINLIFNF